MKDAQGQELVYLSYGKEGSTLRYLGSENIAGIDAQPSEDLDLTPEQERKILDLLTNEDVALLPWLSRALGEQGMTGKTYPVTFSLHNLASKVATSCKITVPKPEVPYTVAASEAGYCADLRDDPYDNGCDGMCGDGCSCWPWVCGDCCWNAGCKIHDDWCRSCRTGSIRTTAFCATT